MMKTKSQRNKFYDMTPLRLTAERGRGKPLGRMQNTLASQSQEAVSAVWIETNARG